MTTVAKEVFHTVTATKLNTHGVLPSMTVSTAAVDRDYDRVLPEGGDFKNFLRNPVLCWGHSRDGLPIGTVTSLNSGPDGVRMQWRWLENDPMADRVKNAWEQGIVRAASIGFIPLRSVRNEYGGEDHKAWELVEVSLVPVPSNPMAVRTLKGLGLWDDRDGTIDWKAINRSASRTAVNVDSRDVGAVIARVVPEMVVRALATMAATGAQRAMNRLTGRID